MANEGLWEAGTGYNRLLDTVNIQPSNNWAVYTGSVWLGLRGQIITEQEEPIASPFPIKVYPNPVTDGVLQIEWAENWKGSRTLALFDLQGKRVKDWQVTAQTDHLSIDGISTGLYFLRVNAHGETRHFKVVVSE